MDLILEQSFNNQTTLNDKEFLNLTEHKHSELFLYVFNLYYLTLTYYFH